MSEEVKNTEVTENPTVVEPENKPEVKTVTMTQEELDALIVREKGRVKNKYADYDEIKAKLDELAKAEEERKKAEMSEAERLLAEKEEAARKAQEAEEQAKKAQESANQRIINTEIRSIARSLNANDPNDVLALLDKSNVEIDEEGNVKGVEDAVKALKEAKPWMFKQAIGADALGGANPPKINTVSELAAKEKELAELQQQAAKNPRLMGRVTKLYNDILSLKSNKK